MSPNTAGVTSARPRSWEPVGPLRRVDAPPRFSVVDLFSGAGGASAGFAAHPAFRLAAAADAEIGKPSGGRGSLGCNDTYAVNLGVQPRRVDLGEVDPPRLPDLLDLAAPPTVLIACPPCTGFSRMNAGNHRADDPRNALVRRVADFVAVLDPQVVVMENARELLTGRFRGHFDWLRDRLVGLGYTVRAQVHRLDEFGLPQARERALVVAARQPWTPRTLADLWSGHSVDPAATHLRRAIGALPPVPAGTAHPADPMHASPGLSPVVAARVAALPHDGGSWRDLLRSPRWPELATPTMRRSAAAGRWGDFPDVYGRLWWDRPAPTVKRECGHVGNGRYTHPSQDRLCTVREMALVQGFPAGWQFTGTLGNRYRHVGDAVPPLISHQLAWACAWTLTGVRPALHDVVLEGTSLTPGDLWSTPHAEPDRIVAADLIPSPRGHTGKITYTTHRATATR